MVTVGACFTYKDYARIQGPQYYWPRIYAYFKSLTLGKPFSLLFGFWRVYLAVQVYVCNSHIVYVWTNLEPVHFVSEMWVWDPVSRIFFVPKKNGRRKCTHYANQSMRQTLRLGCVLPPEACVWADVCVGLTRSHSRSCHFIWSKTNQSILKEKLPGPLMLFPDKKQQKPRAKGHGHGHGHGLFIWMI